MTLRTAVYPQISQIMQMNTKTLRSKLSRDP